MADRDVARPESTDEVQSNLDEGLKSCAKLLASYREALTTDRPPQEKPDKDGWKR